MAELINVFQIVPQREIPVSVDDWVAEPEDQYFTHTKGVIQLNQICKMFGLPDNSPISYFIMSKKRCYNSDTLPPKEEGKEPSIGFRDHCTRYLNYFEKFYDSDELYLVTIYAQLKYLIECVDQYDEEAFVGDLDKYFINHLSAPLFHYKIERFIEDNNRDHMTYRNIKNPCLEYHDIHTKIFRKISFIQNVVIPLIMHFVYIKNYETDQIEFILMRVFDMIIADANQKFHVDMISKLMETIRTMVSRDVNANKTLWEMQPIRGKNDITQSRDTMENIVTKIMPKFVFYKDIISFIHGVIKSDLKNNITGIAYEYTLITKSSSIRDEDNNSETDKFEAHIAKIDEAMILQENVTCDYTMKKIVQQYGPFDEDEIEFYMNELGKDGKPIKNQFQSNLISYLFLKDFKDIKAIRLINYHDYVTLLLAAKKYLIAEGQTLFPFILGGKVEKLTARKTINKKIMQRMEISENYPKVVAKYNNPKIQEDIIFKIISQIIASEFRNIDFKHPDLNGIRIECIPEKICEEVLQYVLLI